MTGACLLIRRDLFSETGGFDARYPVTLNDVDLCCRVRKRGLKVAVSAHARLWHFESLSRGYSRAIKKMPAPFGAGIPRVGIQSLIRRPLSVRSPPPLELRM